MPQRGGAMMPQLEPVDSASPSAAREALQSNLDNTLTLNRKKSWFGSAREAFQRGAKGVVGHLKSGDRKTSYGDDQENVDPDAPHEDDENSAGQPSVSSNNDSLTPLRPARAEWQKSFTPKSAMNSLRLHIQASGKEKAKRGALADITGSPANEIRGPSGPEVLTSIDTDAVVATRSEETSPTRKQHGKTASVAKSMIGSLRSLKRRGNSLSKPTSPDSECTSPTKQATMIPLPSSPVEDPAPTLKLNLGDTANISTSFLSHVPEFDQKIELLALTDPANQAPVRLPTYYTRLPGEGPTDALLSAGRAGKRQALPLDDYVFVSRSTTPIPCIDARPSLDGIDDIFEEPPLFERSVEARDTPEKRDKKSLKKMISIDALAEQHVRNSPLRGMRLTPASERETRLCSASTVYTCPNDMQPLSRQMAAQCDSTDPFAPGQAIDDMPPILPAAQRRELVLPFRPKMKVQTAALKNDSDDPAPSPNEKTSTSDDGSPLIQTTYGGAVLLGKLEAQRIAARVVADRTPQPALPDPAAKVPSVADSVKLFQQFRDGTSTQCSSRLSSAQYDQFHPEHFLGLEECVRGDPPSGIVGQQETPEEGTPERETPEREMRTSENDCPAAVPFYQRVPISQTPSPARMPTGINRTWQFSVQDWMQKGNQVDNSDLQPSPSRRGPDTASLDSVSEQRITPPISPSTTTPKRPPNMGDRVSFELKRSKRNMRYNALSEMSNASATDCEDTARAPIGVMPSPAYHHPMLHGADLDSRPDRDSSFPNFETVFSGSARSSPKERVSPRRYGNQDPSSDSMGSELEEAITDHYVFQNALGGFDVVDSPISDDIISPMHISSKVNADERGYASQNQFEVLSIHGDEPESHQHDEAGSSKLESLPMTKRGRRDSVLDEEDEGELPVEYLFNTPASGVSPTNSLDDCLDLYKSYEACQGHFPDDNPSSESGYRKTVASSPPVAKQRTSERRQQSQSPALPSSPVLAEKKSPSRYRSVKQKKSQLGETYG